MKKGILIIFNVSIGSKFEEFLRSNKIDEFTIIPNVIGKAGTGARYNNEVFPGFNNIAFITIEKNKFDDMKKILDKFKSENREEGITFFSFDID